MIFIRGVKILNLGVVCEIMWKNIVEQGKHLKTIWRMHFACRIPNTTSKHTHCVIHIAFPLPQWLHERSPLLRYTYITFLVRNVIREFCGTCFRWPQPLRNLISCKQCCTYGLCIRTHYLCVHMFTCFVLQLQKNLFCVVLYQYLSWK